MKIFYEQSDHDHSREPFSGSKKAAAWLGLGLCFVVLGASQWLTPAAPPFSGKWSLLESSLYETFGPRGIPIAIFAVGAMFLIAALRAWLKAKGERPTANRRTNPASAGRPGKRLSSKPWTSN